MFKFSERGANAYQSPIRKLVPFADAAKKKGTHVWHLNIGQPDLETPAIGMNAIRNMSQKIISYSPSKGIPSYIKKLTQFYNGFGYNLNEDDVFITTGASEGVIFALLSLADMGDEVIIPEPFYANYKGFAEMAGLVVKPVTARLEDNFSVKMEDFEACITDKTKVIFICNPANPTGKVYSKEELIILSNLCKKYNLFLVVDEVYRELCYSEEPFQSALMLEGMEDRVVIIDSISKRFSATGARIGSLVSRNAEFHNIVLKYAQLRLSSPTFGQVLAEALLDLDQSYFETVKEVYDKRRIHLVNRLQKIDGLTFSNPKGAFFMMIELPILDSDHFCQWLLEDFDYQGETVMLAPGSGFYINEEIGKTQVRVAYVLNEEQIEKAIDCLEIGLSTYKEKFPNLYKFENSVLS